MSVLVNHATFFFDFLTVDGWFHSPGAALQKITLGDAACVVLRASIGPQGQEPDGRPNGQYPFTLHAYLYGCDRSAIRLLFITASGELHEASINDMVAVRKGQLGTEALYQRFQSAVGEKPGATLLDLGGRDRSGIDRSRLFTQAKTTVFDVRPSENVDIVGDAHNLSTHFPPGHFDFVQSIWVFEHLAKPWVVVGELNKVMKKDGLVFISSHQTVGMHDMPWDFWRFSDQAYRSLFNAQTGFEVLGVEMHDPAFILPHLYTHERHHDSEVAAGFISSLVLARKTEDCSAPHQGLSADVMQTPYPG